MLFELDDRREFSEFILLAILKFMERYERMGVMIFGSFYQVKEQEK
jgi:hypothetical protein